MSLFALAVTAATYNCVLTYTTTQDDGSVQNETRTGAFTPDSETPYLVLMFENHQRRNATLSVEPEGSISLQMGDFCGGRYLFTDLTADPGPTIQSTFSYGRDPVTNEWVVLSLACASHL